MKKVFIYSLFITFFLAACVQGEGEKQVTQKTAEESMASVKTADERTETQENAPVTEKYFAEVNAENCEEVLEKVIGKGNDWSELPLSEYFRSMNSPEKGMVEKDGYDEVLVWCNEADFNNGVADSSAYYGLKIVEFDVYFTLDDENQLDTVSLEFEREWYAAAESQGPKRVMDEEHYVSCIRGVSRSGGSDIWELHAFTENFSNTYNSIEGILPNPNYDLLESMPELSSYKDKYVILDVTYGDKIVRYRVEYTTDEELRLDTVKVIEESVRDKEKRVTQKTTEESVASVKTEDERAETKEDVPDTEEYFAEINAENCKKVLEKVIRKGSDWSRLPLSEHFRSMYSSEKGLVEDDSYGKVKVLCSEDDFNHGVADIWVYYELEYNGDDFNHDAADSHAYYKFRMVEYDVYFTLNEEKQLNTLRLEFEEEWYAAAESPEPKRVTDEELRPDTVKVVEESVRDKGN